MEHDTHNESPKEKTFVKGELNLIKSPDVFTSEETWEMMTAARDGDVRKVKSLLKDHPSLSETEFWYTRPIHFAVREGHIDVVRAFLEAGADPTVMRYAGEPMVTTARDRGHEEVARLLEEWIVSKTLVQPEEHEIHRAVSEGNISHVRQLLSEDPSLANIGDADGRTSLHRAVPTGRLDIVGCLIDHGADVNAVQSYDGAYGAYRFQPVDLTLWNSIYWGQRNNYAMTGYLIARGAEYSITIAAALGDINRVKQLLDENPDSVNAVKPCGKRPLSSAIERDHVEIARLLLERGADPNLPEGVTAPKGSSLFTACRMNNLEIARLLLEHGADPDSYIDSSGNCIYNAKTTEMRLLLYAYGAEPMDAFSYIWEDNIDAVAVMARMDPEMVGRSGCGGAFAAVCTQEKRDWMHMLLKLGVRVPPVVTGCRSYLWEHPDMARVLLEHGMDPNLPDWQHTTPLHSICGRDGRGRPDENRVELLDLFLEFGADINAIDEEYRSTPLGWAARNNLPDMVELFLQKGADPHLAGAEWATPIAWAQRRGHREIAQMLGKYG